MALFARLPVFVRLVLVVAAGLMALVLAAFLIKILIVATLLAAIGLGGLFVFNFVRAFFRIRSARLVR
jgi:hypothetical protein